MAALLVVLARSALLITLVAAPWSIGGTELRYQRWLFLGIAVAGTLGWLASALSGTTRLSKLATAWLVLAAALIAIGAFQLIPFPHAPVLKHAELTEELDVLSGNDSPSAARSLAPADTRVQMGRIALAACALLSGAWLFGGRRARQWLWAILALNGVALVGFGLVQRASWNGRLYWTIPLQLGGQPFAAFVNRNNAAEYLSLCLSGALGLWVWRRTFKEVPAWSGKARAGEAGGLFERLPATPWAILILLLFGGVLATLSRAGALSAVAGVATVAVWAALGGRARTLLLPLLGIVVAAVVWIGVSQQWSDLQARLATVTNSLATDGRIAHWTDMRRCLEDFPVWGSGLGTYRYINKPYESLMSETWFSSADNQYLELLVDGGMGAALIMLGVLLLGVITASAWRRCGQLGEAAAAGYVLIAIGLQSVTDCWWNSAANLLTLATLAGALSSPARELDDPRLSPLDKVRQLLASRGGRVSAAALGLCVVVAAGLGLYEVTLAAQSSQFRRSVPAEVRDALSAVELESLLIRGERLALRRQDDAELHAALARLHYFRYRNEAALSLDAVAPQRWSDAARWERTSPQTLFATLARYRQIGDEKSIVRFRESTSVKSDFGAMSEHLLAARRACPIYPRLGLYEAIHELLADGDPALPLRREAALSPASTRMLHSLALSAAMIDDGQLFEVCLSRCLSLDPNNALRYVETARTRVPEPEIVERLLPPAPRPLLDFAESARSVAGREQALLRAAEVVDSPMAPESERAWHRGRIAWLKGDAAAAVQLLKQSVDADGLDAWRRLDYARALHVQGDRVAAIEQLDAARRLAPRDRRLQSRATELDETMNAPRR